MKQHPAVKHPGHEIQRQQIDHAVRHPLRALNQQVADFLAEHVLASLAMFDLALLLPLLTLPMSNTIKITLGVISGSWIQWWALPALQRSSNKLGEKQEAQMDAQHEALTHIATRVDQCAALLCRQKLASSDEQPTTQEDQTNR